MRLTIISFIVVSMLLSVSFSCKKENDGPSAKPIRYITKKDTFNTDVIWYADTIYVIKTYITINGKLTIKPGTIIKFESLSGLNAETVFAVGSKEQPIVFTSIYDDEHGGDVDGDNGIIKPQAGDWISIGYDQTSIQVRYEFCEFYYGGSVMCLTQYTQKISNCIFAHSNGCVLYTTSALLSVSMFTSSSIISNNLFYDNVQPLCIYPGTSIDSTNTFSYKGTGNKQNGIFLFATGYDLNTIVNLQETEVPFVVQGDITIKDGGHLEFANGTIVKVSPSVQIEKLLTGTGSSINGASKSVIFTSFKDDLRGGDTNGDGTLTTPQNGDWEGISDGGVWLSSGNIFYDNH